MNYLAHLYLSGNNDEILVGNMMGDFMKGQTKKKYKEGIEKGIALHHLIDEYTDSHPTVENGKKRLRPIFSHYSPVILDIYYDHFLAKHFEDFSNISLIDFSNNCHKILRSHFFSLPPRLKRFVIYMKIDNILPSYASIEGINKTFYRVAFKTEHPEIINKATDELVANYELYKQEFFVFFDDLKEHTNSYAIMDLRGNNRLDL